MKQLILVRHGNTFGPEDRVVWVGKTNDLPLVDSGLEQAKRVGEALKRRGHKVSALYSSPLVRAKETASLMLEVVQQPLALQIDERLNEIDYGAWAGKSNEEIEQEYSSEPLQQWSSGVWQSEYFNGSESEVQDAVMTFASEVISHCFQEETVVAVSSNGVLRYFCDLVVEGSGCPVAKSDRKVKTGHMCLLERKEESWRVARWNVSPDEW